MADVDGCGFGVDVVDEHQALSEEVEDFNGGDLRSCHDDLVACGHGIDAVAFLVEALDLYGAFHAFHGASLLGGHGDVLDGGAAQGEYRVESGILLSVEVEDQQDEPVAVPVAHGAESGQLHGDGLVAEGELVTGERVLGVDVESSVDDLVGCCEVVAVGLETEDGGVDGHGVADVNHAVAVHVGELEVEGGGVDADDVV